MIIASPEMEGTRAARTTGDSRVLHFQQYNAVLQHTLLEASRIDSREILERAAAEVVFRHLVALPGWAASGPAERLRDAAHLFRDSGLGVLDPFEVGREGGEATVSGSHFAHAWTRRYGPAADAVCMVPAGYLQGALAAVYERAFRVSEAECGAHGAERCRFVIVPAAEPLDLQEAELHPAPSLAAPPDPAAWSMGEAAVADALLADPLRADPSGRIEAYGASLTRLWGDLYSKVSFRFEREVPRVMGNKFRNLASILLAEAGHVGAFHSFGGILASEAWRERVEPHLGSPEDRVHALVAVVDALGWGAWRVHALVPGERLSLRVYDGYEAIGYRRHAGRSDAPRCHLARGAAAAIMNLVYVGGSAAGPELTPSLYNRLFRSPLSYRAVETRCRAMDDPCCELVVNPLSPGLNGRPDRYR